MEKSILRKEISAKKNKLTAAQIAQASGNLAQQLFRHPFYKKAKTIYAYLNHNQEVVTTPIIRQAFRDGKQVAVPKIYDDTMHFVYLHTDSVIEPGYRGIPEPVSDDIANDKQALVLMPGLAFTRSGQRMGYGGGFYDRFLAREPHPTLALCYDFQLVNFLPTEAHDIPVDVVLSAAVMEGSQ